MENNHDIDKTFNEASKNSEEPATFPGFDKVWNAVEEKLDKKQDKKKAFPMWIPYGMAASLLIGSGIFYFSDKKEDRKAAQPVIARNIVESQKNTAAVVPEHIRKLDSMVKSNIQDETLPALSEKIAYENVPKLYTPPLSSPVYEMTVPAFQADAVPAAKEKPMDTVARQNLEEVITMGIRKEKASMVNAMASSAKKKASDFNAVADTAEVLYPNSTFNLNEKDKEPEILAYNKEYVNRNKAVASASVLGNKVGSKMDFNTISGVNSGLRINSVSGAKGSGNVNISIRGNAGSGANPLVIINGVPADIEVFKKLNPEKIQSVQIFKGEKAVPVFGARASNGMIVVETKDISRKEKKKLKKLLDDHLLKK